MRWISIVLMRKINCQNRLYFQKIVLPFVLDGNINQRLPLQTIQSIKKKKNNNFQHILQLWGIWVKMRIQTLYLKSQVYLTGILLGTACSPHKNRSKKYQHLMFQELRRGTEPLWLSSGDSLFIWENALLNYCLCFVLMNDE